MDPPTEPYRKLSGKTCRLLSQQTLLSANFIRKQYDQFLHHFPAGNESKEQVIEMFSSILPFKHSIHLWTNIKTTFSSDRCNNENLTFQEYISGTGCPIEASLLFIQ